MQVSVITMRYQEGLQGFPEDALRAATFGKTVLDVRESAFGRQAPGAARVHCAPPDVCYVLARSQQVATLPRSKPLSVFGSP